MARTDSGSEGRSGLLALLLVLLWATAVVAPPGPSGAVAGEAAFRPAGHERTALRPSRADLADHRRMVVLQQRSGNPKPAPPAAGVDLPIPPALWLPVVSGDRHAMSAAPTVPRAAAPRTAEARAPPVPA